MFVFLIPGWVQQQKNAEKGHLYGAGYTTVILATACVRGADISTPQGQLQGEPFKRGLIPLNPPPPDEIHAHDLGAGATHRRDWASSCAACLMGRTELAGTVRETMTSHSLEERAVRERALS